MMVGMVLETEEDKCEAGSSDMLRSRGDGCGAVLEEPGEGGGSGRTPASSSSAVKSTRGDSAGAMPSVPVDYYLVFIL